MAGQSRSNRTSLAARCSFSILLLLTLLSAMTAIGSPKSKDALEFQRKVREMHQFAKDMEKSGLSPDEVVTVTIPGVVYEPPKPVPVIPRASAKYNTPAQALISWLNANLARDLDWRKEAIHPSEVATIKGKAEKVGEGTEFAIHGIAKFHGIFIFFLTHKSRFSTGGRDYAIVVKTDTGYRFTRNAYQLDRMEEMKLMDVITKNYYVYADTRGKLFKTVLEVTPEPASMAADPTPAGQPADTAVEEENASLSLVVMGVNSKGFPVVTMTNNETRDIDNIMGGISISDSEGNVLFSTGVTDWATGCIYIKAGETKEMSLYITPDAQDRNPEGKRLLREDPQSLTGTFDVKKVTFIPLH